MHPWDLSVDDARMLQESLADDCQLSGDPDIDTVAGVDLSMYPDSDLGIASVVLYSVTQRRIIQKITLLGNLTFPYVSGLLAFREAPLMLEAIMKLDNKPDCLLVDGHGYAHPRRFGLASHLGLLTECPAIGCAKEILVGDFDKPENTSGSFTDIWDGEPVGYAFRSQKNANPIFLSPGHGISRENIPPISRKLIDSKTKLPIPLHRAHKLAKQSRKRIKTVSDPFKENQIGVFLVGGTVRDFLMGIPPDDYDILVTELPESVQNTLEDRLNASFFSLDEDRSMYRFAGDDFQLDVRVVDEDSVVDDLLRRDFTINSIGLDLSKESWIDPCGGRNDIEDLILQPTHDDSLFDDPLRIFRAYRLAQSKNLTFSQELTNQIAEYHSEAERISPERIVDELFKIVSGTEPVKWLKAMKEDNLFEQLSFLRPEGITDLEILQPWNHALRGYQLLGGIYHADYSLLEGFKAARLIDLDSLSQWPFHRDIKTLTSASYNSLNSPPDDEILKLSEIRLVGRIIGKGIREQWKAARLGNNLSCIRRYSTERDKLEKTIVNEIDDESKIGEIKEKKLRKKLPELWNNTMNEI